MESKSLRDLILYSVVTIFIKDFHICFLVFLRGFPSRLYLENGMDKVLRKRFSFFGRRE